MLAPARIRKSGDLSEVRSAGTIFAFTVPRARVLTVPTKPLPFAVKLPMVAMFVSSFVSRAATIATSMAVVDRRAIGPPPQGRHAVEGGQGEAFLNREEWARSD